MLNGQMLSSIASASDTALTITKTLANRERIRHVTDISRVRNELVKSGKRIVDEEYMAYWKSLQKEKIGTIIFGRGGKPNRFAWHYSLKSVAQAANEGKDIEAKQISNVPKEKTDLVVAKPNKAKRGRPFGKKPLPHNENQLQFDLQASEKIVCIMRKDSSLLEFKVPANTTSEELTMLIAALNNLKGV